MAKDENKKRTFDLDKGGKRSFDLKKKPTRAFDLTKDAPEASAAPASNSAKPIAEPTSQQPKVTAPSSKDDGANSGENGNNKKWLWTLLCVIVLAILAYMFISKGQTTSAPSDADTTETVKGDSAQSNTLTGEPSDSASAASSSSSTAPATPSEAAGDNPSQAQPSAASAPAAPQQQEQSVSGNDDVAPSSVNVDEQAQQVIQGVYGNNPERRHKLGADYKKIQKRVNELMRR